jgi:uncharacterized protein
MQSVAITLKRSFWVIILCFAIASFPLPSFAVTVQDVPNPRQVDRGWVTDMANLLDPETKAKLNQMISKLEAENGTEIAVVTVPDTAPSATPKQFATQLFNYWGIGKEGINNGVLFLISKSDSLRDSYALRPCFANASHRVEIETGYGIEKILPNERVGNIIDQLIIPRFKQDDFVGGILAGTQAVIAALGGHDILPVSSKHQSKLPAYIGLSLIFGLIGAVVVWGIAGVLQWLNGDYDTRRSSRRVGDNDGDGGGSWGGDGGSFGGGDSGGAGDGGSW